MDIFNLTNNRLIKMGFESIYSEGIENIGGVFYKSSINYVVLKKVYTYEELNNINHYSTEIRKVMLSDKLNINNTYLMLCTNIDLDYETFFIIERDTKALRKYLIRNEKDLNRIPFLDNSKGSSKKNIVLKKEIEDNTYLNKIFNFIEVNSGQQNKLTKQQIDKSIEMIMDLVGEEIEN